MPEILAICGSARKKGNTALLVNEGLKSTGMESELIFLSDLTIGFCTGCLNCKEKKGKCPKDDDMQVVLDKCLSSKAIVLGSPNYYYDISGLMKNMIDRSIAWCYLGIGEHTGTEWHGWRPFVDKVTGFVISQAAYGGEMGLETLKCFAEWSGLNHVGSVIASVGAQTVKEYPEYIEEAKKLGETIKENVFKQNKIR
ncbi:MAG: flavodoxin family protein [Deltaproteobacteria bacterium]|nr:flavodoxin family protein [Deltaproteobacteria bacterium]